jgi:hypothetical protein
MAVLIDILTVAVTLVGIVLGAVALDSIREQAKASTPWLVDWLRRQAVKRLPEQMREDVAEEWAAWLEETPGPLAKLWCALGFLISAFKVPQPADAKTTKTVQRLFPKPFVSYSEHDDAKWLIWLKAASNKESFWLEAKAQEWLKHYCNSDDPEIRKLYVKVLKAYRNSIAHETKQGGKPEGDDQ